MNLGNIILAFPHGIPTDTEVETDGATQGSKGDAHDPHDEPSDSEAPNHRGRVSRVAEEVYQDAGKRRGSSKRSTLQRILVRARLCRPTPA
jgi:hypothetical protein